MTITLFIPLGKIKPVMAEQSYTSSLSQLSELSSSPNQNRIGQQLSMMLVIAGGGVFGWLALRNKKSVLSKLSFQKINLDQTFSQESSISQDREEIQNTTETTDIATYIKQAYSYFKQGDSQRAIEEFNQAIGVNPQNAYLYGERANFRRKNLGDKQGAIDDYSKAIGIHPQNALFYLWRSQAYNDLGEQKQAMEDYNMALRLAPENTMYHSFQNAANFRE
ncbi:tetratricopeptide repeat protein [Nostoc spongiaeforme FACHB-130]|uniref:Tetratricopeptide repeat protein n=1 Tax=Nostoc spongiaeforme FACHB-130 TaxID=1357510 RepID=A0ABR8FT13_9NOSO|nr:tetratricopeptide repeat protein [Nostoc spongiaeforme]MBD2594065.1 tetratricopeptide repeat protein [Nostoc spongiaeforme FACHB-130]